MFVEQLLVATQGDVIQHAIDGLLRDTPLEPVSESAVRDHVVSRIAAIRDLATAMGEADDEVELYRTVAAFWLELRFEWQRNNEIMNYQTVMCDHADPRVIVEGAIGSFMLSRLELCLDAVHLDMLTRYAMELLADVRIAPRETESAQ